MNNAHIISVFAACAAMVAFADSPLTPSPAPRTGGRNPKHVAAAGGMVVQESSGNAFAYVDCRKTRSDLTPLCDKVSEMAMIKVIQVAGEAAGASDPVSYGQGLLKDATKYGAVVVIFEGKEDQPVLMALPENRIATVNVTPLRKGADEEKFAVRLKKELWRAFAFAAGGACSSTKYCVMQPVLDPSDLDGIECSMASPYVTGSVFNAAPKYGFSRIKRMTYRTACREGWAPAPTNDVQKAIWEKIHSEKERGPINGLKIVPPKK